MPFRLALLGAILFTVGFACGALSIQLTPVSVQKVSGEAQPCTLEASVR